MDGGTIKQLCLESSKRNARIRYIFVRRYISIKSKAPKFMIDSVTLPHELT
jgi:hypothetical protein